MSRFLLYWLMSLGVLVGLTKMWVEIRADNNPGGWFLGALLASLCAAFILTDMMETK